MPEKLKAPTARIVDGAGLTHFAKMGKPAWLEILPAGANAAIAKTACGETIQFNRRSTLHSGIGGLIRMAESKEVQGMTVRRSTLSLVLLCGTYAGLTRSYAAAWSSAQAQQAPTAGDQNNDSSDVQLAARIRKAIVGDKNLSTRAHNVKIIVRNGSVTLRGSVDSEQEKNLVRSKAEQIAGANAVRDLLTVKHK